MTVKKHSSKFVDFLVLDLASSFCLVFCFRYNCNTFVFHIINIFLIPTPICLTK